ncbi:MAG: hypothetical protein ACLQQ4_16640 [Bacteroidia bacterium]
MASSRKFILKKQKPTDSAGYLYMETKYSPKVKSSGKFLRDSTISLHRWGKIEEKYWAPVKQRVKKNPHVNWEFINQEIELYESQFWCIVHGK